MFNRSFVLSTECVTDLDQQSVMIMFYFTFDYFESKYLFGGGPGGGGG
jgi:hypothetical protein